MIRRVLLVAPACDGADVGEAWSAFQWAKRLGDRHDVTVLTYYKSGHTPSSSQLPNCRVVEWAEPPLLGRAERFNSLLKPAYLPFYVRARRWVKKALASGETFDVAHQVTPLALRYPSPVARLGIPFIMGPVGGSLSSPPGFAADGDTAPWYVSLRSLDAVRLRYDPSLRRTYEAADCVLGIAPYVADHLQGVKLRRLEFLSDTASESLVPEVWRSPSSGPLRLLYVGRVVRTKGLRDAIRAVSLLPGDLAYTFDVIGDGPDRAECEALAHKLGVAGQVTFHGRLPRAEIDQYYLSADVFVFPSFREPGGTVVFEAMSFSLPLIVSDLGGPGTAVDDACGVRIHPIDPDSYARDIAAAIRELARDPQRRLSMGEAARRRVESIGLWDSKIEFIEKLYDEIVGSVAHS